MKKAKAMALPHPSAMDDKYKAEGDFHHLMNAQEVQQDPKRLAAAMAHGKKQKKKINGIMGLKEKYKEMMDEEKGEGEA